MKIIRGIGKAVKPLVNFPKWMGWGQISASGKDIGRLAKGLLRSQQATREETFAQAMERLHLTNTDLAQKMQQFQRMALFYGVIALALLGYSFYLLAGAHFAAALLSLVLTVLSGALGFRDYFWYFQIKQRKLGCSIKECLYSLIGGVK